MRTERLQLLLPLPERHGFDPRDFVAAPSNQDALAWFDSDWPERRLAIWGPAGCGKSHLLHIWAGRHGGAVLSGPALTESALTDPDKLPPGGFVALDDADLVKPDEVLFHLLNTARDRGLYLLLSGPTPPARWRVHLPDLSSRLRAITAVEIRPPDEALLSALLMRLLAERQLSVPAPVQAWLLARLPRSAAALRSAVARLDRESLITGRAITRPLAADVLHSAGLIEDDTAPEDADRYATIGGQLRSERNAI
jgi:chromosomal replication initiation ATPase DnaA